MQISRDSIIIGKKLFAIYRDDINEAHINFIPIYKLVNDDGSFYIGVKNDMIGTPNGYFNVNQLSGHTQINTKYLFNIHERGHNI